MVYSQDDKTIFLQNFKIRRIIGKGSFGKVYLVTLDDVDYAMKNIRKDRILKQGLIDCVKIERDVLQQFSHPFIVKLHYAF